VAKFGLTTVWDEQKLARLQRKLGPGIIVPPVGLLIREMADIAYEAAVEKTPRDTGALAASIQKEVMPMTARIYSALPYARIMESGRRPAAVPGSGKMPPPAALAHIAAPGTAFALARSIHTRGIRGRFFLRKARGKIQRELPRLATRLAERIAQGWAAD